MLVSNKTEMFNRYVICFSTEIRMLLLRNDILDMVNNLCLNDSSLFSHFVYFLCSLGVRVIRCYGYV